jgi:hypothetical protein
VVLSKKATGRGAFNSIRMLPLVSSVKNKNLRKYENRFGVIVVLHLCFDV